MTMPLDATMPECVATPDSRDHPRCGSRWGVVHTHPQAERWAEMNLTHQGFDAYLPMHTVLRRDPVLRTLSRPIEVPLFAGYLFVAIPSPHWAPIRHSLGVKRLLMDGENPYLLPDAVLEAVRGNEAVRRTTPTDPTAAWRVGAAVALASGAFTGHPAVVTDTDPKHHRVAVAILLFGELRTVWVDETSLRARE